MSGIQIKDLSFAYEAGGKLILKDINTEIGEGEFVCILGQSGCGKSTLLRLLAGLETATTGEILSDGVAIGEPSLNKGVVFQDYGLFPWMSAGENILLALKQRYPKRDKKELKEKSDIIQNLQRHINSLTEISHDNKRINSENDKLKDEIKELKEKLTNESINFSFNSFFNIL